MDTVKVGENFNSLMFLKLYGTMTWGEDSMKGRGIVRWKGVQWM